jgi:carbonic anhydrase
MSAPPRVSFIIFAAVLAAYGGGEAVPVQKGDPQSTQALRELVKGNRRYANDRCTHPHQGQSRRAELAREQHPLAAVVSCSDSRVPPELIFDEGLGDLFTIRVAGNILDDAVIGSLEYAVEHLHVPLIVVMGHERCGAVEAAIKGGNPHNHIQPVLRAIQPAVKKARALEGDLSSNASRLNVLMAVEKLRNSKPVLAELVNSGQVRVIGAVYDLDTGVVNFLYGAGSRAANVAGGRIERARQHRSPGQPRSGGLGRWKQFSRAASSRVPVSQAKPGDAPTLLAPSFHQAALCSRRRTSPLAALR